MIISIYYIYIYIYIYITFMINCNLIMLHEKLSSHTFMINFLHMFNYAIIDIGYCEASGYVGGFDPEGA
jgi:hypothetical protein